MQPGATITGRLLSIPLSLTPQQENGLCEIFVPLLWLMKTIWANGGMRGTWISVQEAIAPTQGEHGPEEHRWRGRARGAAVLRTSSTSRALGPDFPCLHSVAQQSVHSAAATPARGTSPAQPVTRSSPGAIGSLPSRGQALGRHEMTSGLCCDTGSPGPGADPRLRPEPATQSRLLASPEPRSHGQGLAGEQEEGNPKGPHYSHTRKVKRWCRASTRRPKAEQARQPRPQPRSAAAAISCSLSRRPRLPPSPPRPRDGDERSSRQWEAGNLQVSQSLLERRLTLKNFAKIFKLR